MENKTQQGILYGVSVGPGDPELLTLKAARIIRQAQVIALPQESRENCVAYKMARQAVPEIEQKECLLISMPMTKNQAVLNECHEKGARRILEQMNQGKEVALLTLGDVSVYSTCWYLYRRVRELGGRGELISGVPSFCAAAASLDRALVWGREELHVLPASYQIEEGLKLPGVKVLMKAGKKLPQIKELLQKENFSACGVQRCGMEGQALYRSTEEIDPEAGYYSLFIVDEK